MNDRFQSKPRIGQCQRSLQKMLEEKAWAIMESEKLISRLRRLTYEQNAFCLTNTFSTLNSVDLNSKAMLRGPDWQTRRFVG